jgi:hypothetical protein
MLFVRSFLTHLDLGAVRADLPGRGLKCQTETCDRPKWQRSGDLLIGNYVAPRIAGGPLIRGIRWPIAPGPVSKLSREVRTRLPSEVRRNVAPRTSHCRTTIHGAPARRRNWACSGSYGRGQP